MRNLACILIVAWMYLFCAPSSPARTITVANDAPADFSTIQAAINDANNGDTVEIQPGTYTGEGNRDIDFLGKAITVRSTDPNAPNIVATTIIDCNGTEENPHRGFSFISGEEPNSVLSGLTIKNGYAPNQPEDYDRSIGGAIYIRSSPKIFRCVISHNYAGYSGGGILVHGDSQAKIAYCRITQNSAGTWGGGIMSRFDQDVAIDHCMIDRNSGGGTGGGLYCADARITHCTITDNSAGMRRGGINVSSAASVSHCIVWGNSALLSPDIGGSLSASYSYCNIGIDSPQGLGNISADPRFVNQAAGDYHLSAESPCVHVGDASLTPTPAQVDFDGEPRVLLGRIDIGADEFSGDGPYVYISPKTFAFEANESGENPPSQELSITNIGNINLNWSVSPTCSWLHVNPSNGDSSGETDKTSLTVDISGLPAGLHTCELIAGDPCALNVFQSATVALNIDDGDSILHVPSEYPTIQAAIDWSKQGDTVILAPGIYTGEGNRDIDFLGKAITARSPDPSDSAVVAATVIDCEGSPDDLHRGFVFQNGEDANSVISGLTIRGGYADYGGAVYCEGSAGPSIKYCTIAGNTAREGGGIYIVGENLSAVIENCIIVGNRAMPNPTYWWHPTGLGGGICIEGRNYVAKSHPDKDDSELAEIGKEKARGGYREVTTFCTIANCTLTQNIAERWGGGICRWLNCEVTVTNSIVWGNTAQEDDDISLPVVADGPNPEVTISYSNIKHGLDGIDGYYFVEWGEGNIDAPPCFADPGHWDPNGTFDDVNDHFWVHGDYHLMSEAWRWDMARKTWTWDAVTSRCIDAGNPALTLGDEPLSVPPDPDNNWGTNLRINMGAYGGAPEAGIPPYGWTLVGDITNNGHVHFDDLSSQIAYWLIPDPKSPGNLNRDTLINLADYAALTSDWQKETSWFGTTPGPPPYPQAWNPSPPDGFDGVELWPVLSWESGYGAISNKIYFGTKDPPEFQNNQTANTFEPGPLSSNTIYYWRIDEETCCETTTGPVWRFTTNGSR